MNYEETLSFLYNRLPIYQRIGGAAYKSDLNNTILLCKRLGNPEKRLKAIHVAGTNGKGSTSHMLASIFQESGYKVGLYTSPHLKDFRERIRINGKLIDKEYIVGFVRKFKDELEKIDLSFFEWTVGLCFDFFSKSKVDLAIIETGLGGRLDSTNVISPEISLITNVGMDHTQFLGDTLPKIAKEKAGIIKSNTPVVIGEYQDEIAEVFIQKAKELDAPIVFADNEELPHYKSDLKGSFQEKNIKSAVAVVDILKKNGWEIIEKDIVSGLLNVVRNTRLKGRWQVLSEHPLTICDTGHNISAIEKVIDQIENLQFDKLHMVFGINKDKMVDQILNLLPKRGVYYFCKASVPRSMDVEELLALAKPKGIIGTTFSSVSEAYNSAKKASGRNDLIFIGGSTFVVSEVL